MSEPTVETERRLVHRYVTNNGGGAREIRVCISYSGGALVITQTGATLRDGKPDIGTLHQAGVTLEPSTVTALLAFIAEEVAPSDTPEEQP